MQAATEDIIKILPKGLITIPKKWREDLGFKENSLARVKKEGRRLVLEPIRVVGYPLRDYSKKELRQFLKEDRIDNSLAKKVRQLLQ